MRLRDDSFTRTCRGCSRLRRREALGDTQAIGTVLPEQFLGGSKTTFHAPDTSFGSIESGETRKW